MAEEQRRLADTEQLLREAGVTAEASGESVLVAEEDAQDMDRLREEVKDQRQRLLSMMATSMVPNIATDKWCSSAELYWVPAEASWKNVGGGLPELECVLSLNTALQIMAELQERLQLMEDQSP